MQTITEILHELDEKESSGLLRTHDLRLILLKAMNYILRKYGLSSDERIMKCVDQLQDHYNHLSDLKMVTTVEIQTIKQKIAECLSEIKEVISKHA